MRALDYSLVLRVVNTAVFPRFYVHDKAFFQSVNHKCGVADIDFERHIFEVIGNGYLSLREQGVLQGIKKVGAVGVSHFKVHQRFEYKLIYRVAVGKTVNREQKCPYLLFAQVNGKLTQNDVAVVGR